MLNCGRGRAGRFWTNRSDFFEVRVLTFLKWVGLCCYFMRKRRVGGCKRVGGVLEYIA